MAMHNNIVHSHMCITYIMHSGYIILREIICVYMCNYCSMCVFLDMCTRVILLCFLILHWISSTSIITKQFYLCEQYGSKIYFKFIQIVTCLFCLLFLIVSSLSLQYFPCHSFLFFLWSILVIFLIRNFV